MVQKIFINYRRVDARVWADLVRDSLAERYGPENVFLDIDASMPLGKDYRASLRRAVEQCDALIAIIGPHWGEELRARAEAHERAPDVSPDSVRVEIAHALSRGVPVVPLLLEGATAPSATALPEDLQALAFRQSETADRASRAADLDRLAERLSEVLGAAPAPQTRPTSPAAAAFADIEDGLDPLVYRDFAIAFPNTQEAFTATRRARWLDEWRGLDQTNRAAIDAWRPEGLKTYPALSRVVADAVAAIEGREAEQEREREITRLLEKKAKRDRAVARARQQQEVAEKAARQTAEIDRDDPKKKAALPEHHANRKAFWIWAPFWKRVLAGFLAGVAALAIFSMIPVGVLLVLGSLFALGGGANDVPPWWVFALAPVLLAVWYGAWSASIMIIHSDRWRPPPPPISFV